MSEFLDRCSSDEGRLTYHCYGSCLTVEAWGPDGLRVRILPDGSHQTSDWALDIPQREVGTTEIHDDYAVITNGRISAEIRDNFVQKGFLSFYRHDGEERQLLLQEHDYGVYANNPGTHSLHPLGDGLYSAELHLASNDGEHFYGMGENATAHLDLKGSVIDLYQRHVKAPVPFVVSSRNYGFLWNNPSLGRVEFANNLTRWVSDGCRQIDFYITTGKNYAEIMSHYADVTGHAPMLPYWASGFWQCKLRYENQEQLLEVAREYKRRGLPLSVIVIDYMHWKKLGDWQLDPDFWPDPDAMVRELNEMGVRVMVSPWILVAPDSLNFAYMKEHGLFTGSTDGQHDTVDFLGPVYQYDPTNPEAAEYLWSKWKENYVDHGMKTFWLDPCDDCHELADYDKATYYIGPAKECHSYFVIAHQKNVHDGLVAAGEPEVVTICRNAWAGSQRYGACPAPHDILSSFAHMRQYMLAGLNVMMSGIPWWNCDIGGFITHDNQSDRFHELMIRWFQYGVFMPIFRTHGYRPNNEVWTIGGNTYEPISQAMLMRERLRPYIMEQMSCASKTGTPPMRPLFYDFSEDPKSYQVEDAFLFGPDIYVAPITEYGTRDRLVYLPEGTSWIDVWTGEVINGGLWIKADAPLEHIPLFVRSGAESLVKIITG